MKQRIRYAHECLNEVPVNIKALKAMAFEPHGFLTKDVRKRVWPKLLGIDRYTQPYQHAYQQYNDQEQQVMRDIERSMWSVTSN